MPYVSHKTVFITASIYRTGKVANIYSILVSTTTTQMETILVGNRHQKI